MVDYWPQGTDFPFGIHASHSWEELGAIFRVIDEYNINAFVELGTFKGGLVSLMEGRIIHHPTFEYVGIEKEFDALVDTKLRRYVWDGNVFHHIMMRDIREWLLIRKRNYLIYCDNGDKPREVKTYLKYMPVGTYVMAHDWGTEILPRDLEMIEVPYRRIIPHWFTDTMRLVLLEKLDG
jgi:hypothetical protein